MLGCTAEPARARYHTEAPANRRARVSYDAAMPSRRRPGRATLAVVAFVVTLAVIWLVAPQPDIQRAVRPAPRPAVVAPGPHPDLLYGRVTAIDGETFTGRLRWAHREEATWDDLFNGFKAENPWAAYAPPVPVDDSRVYNIFGFELGKRDAAAQLRRPVVIRFGDLVRLDATRERVTATLKSGSVVTMTRDGAGDFGDGVRVWSQEGHGVELDARRIRSIEFHAPEPSTATTPRLYGTVQTRGGTFEGFIAWNRDDSLTTDPFEARVGRELQMLPFSSIAAIERRPPDESLVTTTDARTLLMSGTSDANADNRGVSVDDARMGRVVVFASALIRVDFRPAPRHTGYADFAPGRPIDAEVVTSSGARVVGRLVFDLDESETTDVLDATAGDITYTLPFSHIDSIAPHEAQPNGALRAVVTTRGGDTLVLDRSGDLADSNAGLLVFVAGATTPTYVAWRDVARITLR